MFLDYIKILRPKHWLKNLMLFFPPFFAGTLFSTVVYGRALGAFWAFSVTASAMYIFNDIADADRDAKHPIKRKRPIPAGKISKERAAILAVILLVIGLVMSGLSSLTFLFLVIGYIGLTLSYSYHLKQIAIADIFCIAGGFLLRLEAGGQAFDVAISPWLFLTVFLLSLFLALGKRYAEFYMLGEGGKEHRPSLASYSLHFLRGAMFMAGSAALVAYTMYVVVRPTLVYTAPLCCYGLFRYILLVFTAESGDPIEVILHDRQMFVISFLWAAMVFSAIYME